MKPNLVLVEMVIDAAFFGNQFIVRTDFNDFPFFKHENLVCFADSGKPVRDDECRTSFHEPLQRFGNDLFRFCVKRACWPMKITSPLLSVSLLPRVHAWKVSSGI